MSTQTHPSIYLDGHSTTPLAPEALELMQPWWHSHAGNPSSPHSRGASAASAVDEARRRVAALVNADPQEIVFTSGATEANNIAIIGVARAAIENGDERREILVSSIEHKSVIESAKSLIAQGFTIREIPVRPNGVIDTNALLQMTSDRTLLVSTMAVNNEVGTIQPIGEITSIVRNASALIHVDAAQALGKLRFDATQLDYASFSSHKIYGPMGSGALFVSAAAQLRPKSILFGGAQEKGIRPGTVPTPLIVGFGAAARIADERLEADAVHNALLSKELLSELDNRQVRYDLTVPREYQVPGSISLRFEGHDAISLIGKLGTDVSVSEGSACNSGEITPSHVLNSLGKSHSASMETIRIYCGRYNTLAEISAAATAIARALKI